MIGVKYIFDYILKHLLKRCKHIYNLQNKTVIFFVWSFYFFPLTNQLIYGCNDHDYLFYHEQNNFNGKLEKIFPDTSFFCLLIFCCNLPFSFFKYFNLINCDIDVIVIYLFTFIYKSVITLFNLLIILLLLVELHNRILKSL